MNKTIYQKVIEVFVTCKCGTKIRTSSVEYFCPRCGTVLSNPISVGNSTAHIVYDYIDEIELEE